MAENTTIARPYAEAVFKLAKEQGDLKGWSDKLQLVSAVAASPEMGALIGNPKVSKGQLSKLILDICGDKLDATGKNLVTLLVENGRIGVATEIAAHYELSRAEAEGSVEAEAISALPLTDEQQKVIAAALTRRLGRNVELVCKVDKDLLGGAIIRTGDLVIDGSAASRLTQLAKAMLP
jgi:F-type H+-transporting ATPase subunit delta